MADLFFTRACSLSSAGNLAVKSAGGVDSGLAGGLRSGLGASGSRLSDNENLLLHNFLHQCNLPEGKVNELDLEHATALVSVSDRVVDTLKRAFNKYYVEKEPPESIYIVFIRIQANPQGLLQTCSVAHPNAVQKLHSIFRYLEFHKPQVQFLARGEASMSPP